MANAFDAQVGGDHYKKLVYQPLEIILKNKGFAHFEGACLTKILKYTMRTKDDPVEQYKKAQHVLSLLIQETEKHLKEA